MTTRSFALLLGAPVIALLAAATLGAEPRGFWVPEGFVAQSDTLIGRGHLELRCGDQDSIATALVNLLHFLDENRNAMMVAFIQEPEGSATRAELADLIASNVKKEIASGHFRAEVSAKLFAEIIVGIIAQIVRSPLTRGRREKQGRHIAELLLNGVKA